jgi:di/tricarboxylate transporter
VGDLTFDQGVVFAVLGGALVLFIRGPFRYDVVALLALFAVTVTGIVPASEAFAGFGHPAVITVAAVLVISAALQEAGLVELLASRLARLGNRIVINVVALTVVVAVLSAFMNNVGALALMMPVAIRLATRGGFPPSVLLMPLAFASLLGGLTTLIGTPPNIIIASFRETETGDPFRMFDFAPVGVMVAAAGVAFIGVAGWRLVPRRVSTASDRDIFEIDRYLSEVTVPSGCRADGALVRDIESVEESYTVVAGILRAGQRFVAPSAFEVVRAGDVLSIEADPDTLGEVIRKFGLEFTGSVGGAGIPSEQLGLMDAVILPRSPLVGRTPHGIALRTSYGVNLLAVARTGAPVGSRLSGIRLMAGDIVLLQAPAKSWAEVLRQLACAPLRSEPELPERTGRRVLLASLIFGTALVLTATGVLAAQVSLSAAALGMVIARVIRPGGAYESIDWPIIVLLGAMLPVGTAFETSGSATRVADAILSISRDLPDVYSVIVLMVATMLLSNVLNNAAAAVLMAPIGIGLAHELGVSVDPLLMAVAIGASSPFLTPIGHQSNTLVFRPGGYRFGDYWRLGLPLQAIVVAVAVPMLLVVWPL